MQNRLKGGLSDNKTLKWFVKHCGGKAKFMAALKKGVSVELEHTSDIDLCAEIALDHLAEDCLYYDKLEDMEAGNISEANFKDERDEFSKYGQLSIKGYGLYDGTAKIGDADLQLLRSGKKEYLYLNSIEMDDSMRGKGYFGKFLKQLADFADAHNLPISLEAGDTFGSDLERLKAGYAKYGFRPNTSSMSGNMVRK